MRRGILRLSMAGLHRALHLPENVTINHISQDSRDFSMDQCSVYLKGTDDSDLPDIPEGCMAPHVDAEIRQNDDGSWAFLRWSW